VIKPDSDERKIAIFKDNKLRLLMALAGFQRIGVDEPDASWIIPSFLTSAMLKETRDIIEKHRNDPKREYSNDDGEPISAEDMLRRKPTANRRAEFDDESDKEGQDSLDEFLFPAGGPTIRRSTDVVAEPKRRSKQRIERGDELDEETQAARRRARELADLEKRRKIKSLEFVNDSDDYSDEERDKEFWANEERIRKGQSLKVREALQTVGAVSDGSESPGSTQGYGGSSARLGKKRKSGGVVRERSKRARNNNTEQESEDEDLVFGSGGSSSPRRNVAVESSDEESETPISLQNEPPLKDGEVENALDMDIENPSQGIGSSKASKSPGSLEGDEDARPVFPSTAKRRGRLTVLEDSDDE
jgi:replication fork protection complex subunit Tof1/Swi1